MIHAERIRELVLGSPSSPHRGQVSAASGLVLVGDFLYVVADDEHHLGVFRAEGNREGELIRIFPGDLPQARRARKAEKPDLEVLTRLPSFDGYPAGALLALASGSKPNRRTGAVLGLDASGAIVGRPRPIDLSDLYIPLELQCPALNIEGAVIAGSELILLQRGSKGHPTNASIHMPLADVLDAISTGDSVGSPGSLTVHAVDLGVIDDVPLCFTDGAALPDGRIIFTAVAENAEDTYEDGPCTGAAIGILGTDCRLQRLERLQPTHKVEGIHAWIEGALIRMLLVTDADDRNVPSSLLSAELPASAGRQPA